jgi:hypothetical protein
MKNYNDRKKEYKKYLKKEYQEVLKLSKGTKSIEQKGQTLNKSNKKTLTGECKHNTYGARQNKWLRDDCLNEKITHCVYLIHRPKHETIKPKLNQARL